MLGAVGSNLTMNNTQHVATHRNMVAKRTQHVTANNAAICCVDMLRSFGRRLSLKNLEILIQPTKTLREFLRFHTNPSLNTLTDV